MEDCLQNDCGNLSVCVCFNLEIHARLDIYAIATHLDRQVLCVSLGEGKEGDGAARQVRLAVPPPVPSRWCGIYYALLVLKNNNKENSSVIQPCVGLQC